jgi:flagellar hook-length control protein FliK
MSTATPSSAASTGTAHAAQASARPGAPGQRKAGAQDAADLFASMLSLLSATDDAPAIPVVSDAALEIPSDLAATPQAQGDATLAAMMQWAGLPQAGGAARALSVASDTATPLNAAQTTPLNAGIATAAAPAATGLPLDTGQPTGSKAPDPLPQGMQVLAHAEVPDAQTLAALSDAPTDNVGEIKTPTPSAAEAAPAGTAATSPAQNSAARPANSWRGQPPATATHSLQQTHHDAAQVDRLQVRLHTDVAAAVRSTVALDERFANTATASDSPLVTATGASVIAAASSPGSGGSDLSGQPGSDGDAGPQTFGSDHTRSDDDTGDGEPRVDEDWAPAQENLDAFASPNLRQASLRVGEAGEDAIDIQLSLNGMELNLGFRTDNADARAALARHAEGGLSELLQRGGIQLGDVSVGSQSGQSGSSHPQQTQARGQPTALSGNRGSRGDADAAPIAPLQPRRDGNRPLDLFV